MKGLKKIFIALLFTLIFWPGLSFADDSATKESLPADALNKIPEEFNLVVNGSSYPINKVDIENLLKERNFLSFDKNYSSEIENINICQYNSSLACRLSFPYKNQLNIKKIYDFEISDEALSNFIEDLARKVNKDPVNAKFKVEGGKVTAFSLSSPGFRLNKQKSLENFKEYLLNQDFSNPLELSTQKIQPEISSDSQDNLGINSLIGSGESNFAGSPKNRVYNIKVATNRFNGTLIKPGEEFSFVKILGEVDGEHGYLPELVIKHDKTEAEFGGGICQVSTTTFRAAINSGLEITARRNHAYPVSYYNPQGMDATVYVPRPDLRFINNTPGYVLIETQIEGTKLIFNFYGTDDGRKVNIIGPKILSRESDGSMKTTFTQQVFDKDDKLILEDVFNSNYDSPNKYPHPGSEPVLTKKPSDWSSNEWKEYKKAHGI